MVKEFYRGGNSLKRPLLTQMIEFPFTRQEAIVIAERLINSDLPQDAKEINYYLPPGAQEGFVAIEPSREQYLTPREREVVVGFGENLLSNVREVTGKKIFEGDFTLRAVKGGIGRVVDYWHSHESRDLSFGLGILEGGALLRNGYQFKERELSLYGRGLEHRSPETEDLRLFIVGAIDLVL